MRARCEHPATGEVTRTWRRCLPASHVSETLRDADGQPVGFADGDRRAAVHGVVEPVAVGVDQQGRADTVRRCGTRAFDERALPHSASPGGVRRGDPDVVAAGPGRGLPRRRGPWCWWSTTTSLVSLPGADAEQRHLGLGAAAGHVGADDGLQLLVGRWRSGDVPCVRPPGSRCVVVAAASGQPSAVLARASPSMSRSQASPSASDVAVGLVGVDDRRAVVGLVLDAVAVGVAGGVGQGERRADRTLAGQVIRSSTATGSRSPVAG